MAQIRYERTVFVFRVGMEIKNDLNALRQRGWSTVKNSHFTTKDVDGTQIITLMLRRPVQINSK